MSHNAGNPNVGLPVQYVWGMTSCSEWTGVPLSVLLNEAGVQKEASWLVVEGADAGKFSHTLPLAKAMDDVIVAYGQNGEPVRPEQGYPLRLVVPGWEGPFSVKFLSHIKVVDHPLDTWTGEINHPPSREPIWAANTGGTISDRRRIGNYPAFSWTTNTRSRGYVEINGMAWSGGG